MPKTEQAPQFELINVHRVIGDKEVMKFLKNADHEFVEGLFYTAKRYGRSEFFFQDLKYEMLRNRDFSFTVQVAVEQDFSTEQFS